MCAGSGHFVRPLLLRKVWFEAWGSSVLVPSQCNGSLTLCVNRKNTILSSALEREIVGLLEQELESTVIITIFSPA